MAYAIIMNHPFNDGNKRTGILVMLITLRLNNISIKYTQDELIVLGLSIADGNKRYKDILAWMKSHLA